MAWFLNHYLCYRCDTPWTDEWSCMCDDDCPHCGARHTSPYKSKDLTTVIEKDGDTFVVYPDSPRIRRTSLPNGAIGILPNG